MENSVVLDSSVPNEAATLQGPAGLYNYGQYLLDDLRRGVQVDEALVHAHLESATLAPSVSAD
jgi:hypothetical protein